MNKKILPILISSFTLLFVLAFALRNTNQYGIAYSFVLGPAMLVGIALKPGESAVTRLCRVAICVGLCLTLLVVIRVLSTSHGVANQ